MENKFAASDSEVRDSGSLLAPSRLSARVALSATGAEPAVAGANSGEGAATSTGRSILRPSALSASSCSAVSGASVSARADSSSSSQWPPSSSCSSSSSSSLSKPAAANTTPSFQLQPPRFRNPFASTSKALEGAPSTDTDSDAGGGGGGENGSGESGATAAPPAGISDNCSSGGALFGATASDRVTSFSSVANGAKSGSSAPVAFPVPVVPVSAGFVFGENLRDRVTNASEPVAKAADGNTDIQCEHGHSSSSDQTPADSGATAPAAAATDTTAANCSATSSSALGTASAKSLLEQSAEQCEREKARALLHTLEEVPVVTGEENEHNVLHIGCKLYAFEKSSCSYRERGRGQLRLNDRLPQKEEEAATAADGDGAGEAAAAGGGGGGLQSRLVFRVQGSMRLALNAQLWPAMEVQRPSARDVRVTALDGDQVRVFLLKCSAKDAGLLFDELQWRVRALQESNGGETPTAAAAAAAATTAVTADDSDSTSDSIKMTTITTTTNTANTQSSQQQRDAERQSDAEQAEQEHVAIKRRKVDTD